MSKIIRLDAGLFALVSNPRTSLQVEACRAWVRAHEAQGNLVVSEIADYEVRHDELTRVGTE